MSNVNPFAYAFEDALERAAQAWLLSNGVNDPKRQRENKNVVAPRVAVQAIFGGFSENEHYYIRTSDGARFLDIGAGTLRLMVITRRDDKDVTHAALRGQCRYLMQFANQLTGRMPLHQVEKIIETASSVSVDKNHDISSLNFNVWLRILPLAFAPNPDVNPSAPRNLAFGNSFTWLAPLSGVPLYDYLLSWGGTSGGPYENSLSVPADQLTANPVVGDGDYVVVQARNSLSQVSPYSNEIQL